MYADEKAEETEVEVRRHQVTLSTGGTHLDGLGTFPEFGMFTNIYYLRLIKSERKREKIVVYYILVNIDK